MHFLLFQLTSMVNVIIYQFRVFFFVLTYNYRIARHGPICKHQFPVLKKLIKFVHKSQKINTWGNLQILKLIIILQNKRKLKQSSTFYFNILNFFQILTINLKHVYTLTSISAIDKFQI